MYGLGRVGEVGGGWRVARKNFNCQWLFNLTIQAMVNRELIQYFNYNMVNYPTPLTLVFLHTINLLKTGTAQSSTLESIVTEDDVSNLNHFSIRPSQPTAGLRPNDAKINIPKFNKDFEHENNGQTQTVVVAIIVKPPDGRRWRVRIIATKSVVKNKTKALKRQYQQENCPNYSTLYFSKLESKIVDYENNNVFYCTDSHERTHYTCSREEMPHSNLLSDLVSFINR